VVTLRALKSYAQLYEKGLPQEELASQVYALFVTSAVSKATAAQYLACLLEGRRKKGELFPDDLRQTLPKYLVAAIEYVTAKSFGAEAATEVASGG
jgi:putative ATP-dependent endonuclease of OLD family